MMTLGNIARLAGQASCASVLLGLAVLLFVVVVRPAQANDVIHYQVGAPVMPLTASSSFPAEWLAGLRAEAVQNGIRPDVFDQAMSGVQYLHRSVDLDQKQPEKTRTYNDYRESVLSPKRVAEGRRLYREHRSVLREISQEYGVPAGVIVALWGVETHYGKVTGGFEVIDSLTTLAYEGRRAAFFRKELIAALRILQDGHVGRHEMKGSWAGAMGQCQFMPSSFLLYAQDYDGDGRMDIWKNLDDVFASTANYLNQSGWREGDRWGREVKLSPTFNEALIGLETTHPLSFWAQHGVTLKNGKKLPNSDIMASVVRPQGEGRQAYLAYPNYRVIMAWNKSTYFATTVGLLSDLVVQEP